MSPTVLFFTGMPVRRNGKILVITSTWVVFLAQMKRLGGRNHSSTAGTKKGGLHYSMSSGDWMSSEAHLGKKKAKC